MREYIHELTSAEGVEILQSHSSKLLESSAHIRFWDPAVSLEWIKFFKNIEIGRAPRPKQELCMRADKEIFISVFNWF